jgi:hypothetical protein
VPRGAGGVAHLAGRQGFGDGADGALAGVGGAESCQPQFPTDVTWCPAGLGGVGVADQSQPSVWQAANVRAVYWAEGGEGLVPGGSLVWHAAAGFGSDRVAGVLIAVHLTVGSDLGGLALPAAAGGRICRDRAESGDRPGRCGVGGVLAQALSAVIHHDRDLGRVGAAVRGGQVREPSDPGALPLGQQRVDTLADPGVQDGGDVPGSGQVPAGDGGADDFGGVQAC